MTKSELMIKWFVIKYIYVKVSWTTILYIKINYVIKNNKILTLNKINAKDKINSFKKQPNLL